jgi:hypothetical protein
VCQMSSKKYIKLMYSLYVVSMYYSAYKRRTFYEELSAYGSVDRSFIDLELLSSTNYPPHRNTPQLKDWAKPEP